MFVNKFTLNLNNFNTGTTEQYVNIPLNGQYQIVDNAELIDRVFVANEVENSINKILDYDRVRYVPLTPTNSSVATITYDLSLFDSNNQYTTFYGFVGYEDDDVIFRKNAFTKSFLRLSFFDSDDAMVQNLVGFTTLYSRLSSIDLLSGISSTILGLPKPIQEIPINFTVDNPLINKRGFAEGFHIYYYGNDLNIGDTKYLYMKANFNNAKTGKSINLMVKNSPQEIQNLVHELYTRVKIIRTSTGYFYKFDESYQGVLTSTPITQNNITYVGNTVNIKLYQVDAL
jgi:hypothetical protein